MKVPKRPLEPDLDQAKTKTRITLAKTDTRMLQLIDHLKALGKIKYRQEFCDAIGIEKQNIRNIKIGERRFTIEQVEKAIKVYKVNPSWIFGLDKNVFRL